MKQLIFCTGNADKFLAGRQTCKNYGIELMQKTADITEIQSEDVRAVALDKATKVFEHFRQPVVITDDFWNFDGLNGFPGAYMHSMNHWLTAQDFLRLVQPLENRRMTFTQCLVYMDTKHQQVFTHQTSGHLLKEIRGRSEFPSFTIVSLDDDDGLSLAEVYERTTDRSGRQTTQVWRQFAEWFNQQL